MGVLHILRYYICFV